MGSYKRKNGTVIQTKTAYDEVMNERGISKIVHVIPARPAFKSREVINAWASFFGPAFIDAAIKAHKEVPDPGSEVDSQP